MRIVCDSYSTYYPGVYIYIYVHTHNYRYTYIYIYTELCIKFICIVKNYCSPDFLAMAEDSELKLADFGLAIYVRPGVEG